MTTPPDDTDVRPIRHWHWLCTDQGTVLIGSHERDDGMALMPDDTTAPVPADDLRAQLISTLLASWVNQDLPSSQTMAAEAAARDVDTVLAVLSEDPGDLPARMATEMRRHDIEESTHAGYRCSCGQTVTDWDEHLAAAAMSVRWEHAARLAAENDYRLRRDEHLTAENGRFGNRLAALEANGAELLAKGERLAAENDRLERQVATIHCPVCARGDCAPTVQQWRELFQDAEQAKRELAETRTKLGHMDEARRLDVKWRQAAEAQVAAIRRTAVDVYGEDYAGEDVPAEITRLLGQLADERAHSKRAYEKLSGVERELTEAKQAVYTARLTHIREWHPSYALMGACSGCQALAPLSAAMPSRPDDPEEIRRLAQATTESTEESHE